MLTSPEGRRSLVVTPQLLPLELKRNHLRAGRTRIPLDGAVNPRDALKLTCVGAPASLGATASCALAQLASSGVIVVAPEATWPDVVTFDRPPTTAYEAETWSVMSRRLAWLSRTQSTTVSAVVCSNRPARLPSILRQLADQVHSRLEVVVMLHGVSETREIAKAVTEAHARGLVVKTLQSPASLAFGAALTEAAQAADGEVVTKVDDDDLYGPWHVTDLLMARAYSGAPAVGKALQYVHLEEIDISVRQGNTATVSEAEAHGTWVCGGTLTVDADLGRSVGWFDPVHRAVDRNLQDKVLRGGGTVYRTHGLDYVYVRHSDGHTYTTDWVKYLRGAIEQRPGVWPITPKEYQA